MGRLSYRENLYRTEITGPGVVFNIHRIRTEITGPGVVFNIHRIRTEITGPGVVFNIHKIYIGQRLQDQGSSLIYTRSI